MTKMMMIASGTGLDVPSADGMWNFQLFGKTFTFSDVMSYFSIFVLISFACKFVKRNSSTAVPANTKLTLPGPWNFPIVGYLPKLGSRPFVEMWNLSRRYGNVYRIRMGSHDVVVVNGLETLREAFVRQGRVFSGRPALPSAREFARGHSMTFHSYSDVWSVHNKTAVRALHSFVTSKTRPIDDVVRRNAVWLTDRLLSRSGTAIDIHDVIETAVLRVLYELCFGDDVTDEFCESMKRELEHLRKSMSQVLVIDMMPWLGIFLRSQFGRFKKTLSRFSDLVDRLASSVRDKTAGGQPTCIVQSLMRAWEELEASTESSITIEKEKIFTTVQDLIGGGSEGVVNFIYWAIRYMIAYPEVHERLLVEVRGTISLDTMPLEKDIASMPFVEAFIWEVIRHSSMSPLTLPHSTLQDTVLAGYHIPKGTVVFGNLYSTSHDPHIWADPEKFDPDRFLDAGSGKLDRIRLEQFQCFGLGRRRCIGEQLARVEMFLFLVIILQKCQFSCCPSDKELLKMDGEMSLVYRSRPYKVIVHKYSRT